MASLRHILHDFPLNEEWYQSLFDNNPLPMWVYDLETLKFLAVNDAAVQKYGYSASKFLTMTIRDIRPKEEFQRLEDHVRGERSDFQESGVWIHNSKKGNRYFVEITSHTIEYKGRPAAFVVVHDVTANQNLQEELRRSEERMQSLFDNAAIGIYRTTPSGKILACNPAGVRMLGFDSFDEMANIGAENKVSVQLMTGRHSAVDWSRMAQ